MTKQKAAEHLGEFKKFALQVYENWRNDRTLRLGAGLAYYITFSIVPITALSIYISSALFPRGDVVAYLQRQATAIFGGNIVEVSNYIDKAILPENISNNFTHLGFFGLIAVLFTSSLALLALHDSINIIWGKPVTKSLHHTARRYVFSYIMVLSLSLILISVLSVQALVLAIENNLHLNGPVVEFLGSIFTSMVTWAILIAALAWLIRIMTDKRVSRRHALLGSAVTTALMYVGVFVTRYYLVNFSLKSITSAFGAVLLILAWVYYESQILLAGLQLTKTLSTYHARREH